MLLHACLRACDIHFLLYIFTHHHFLFLCIHVLGDPKSTSVQDPFDSLFLERRVNTFSPFLRIPWIHFPSFAPVDFMHNVLLGVGKNAVEQLLKIDLHSNSRKQFSALYLQACTHLRKLGMDFSNIGDCAKFAESLKAAEIRNVFLLTPAILHDLNALPDLALNYETEEIVDTKDYRTQACLLLMLVSNFFCWGHSQFVFGEVVGQILQVFHALFSRGHDLYDFVPNLHLLQHFAATLQLYGQPVNTWAFPQEREYNNFRCALTIIICILLIHACIYAFIYAYIIG